MPYKEILETHFIRGPIYLRGISRWQKISGPMGALLYIALQYRRALGRKGERAEVTLKEEARKIFGLGDKVMRRLRRQLTSAGVMEWKKNSGRPYRYKILDGSGVNLKEPKESFNRP